MLVSAILKLNCEGNEDRGLWYFTMVCRTSNDGEGGRDRKIQLEHRRGGGLPKNVGEKIKNIAPFPIRGL